MSHYMTTEGIYMGCKTGVKKGTNEPWFMLQFKVPEIYKGSPISAESLALPNLSGFPADDVDHSKIQVGQKCLVGVAVSAKAGLGGRPYPEYRIVRVNPR
jgi:hypothetical protein